MNRYLAAFAGLFLFTTTMGCAAEAVEDAGEEAPSEQEQHVRAADLPSAVLPSAASASTGPTCLSGKYTSGWSTIELLPDGQGLRTDRVHDGRHSRIAQGRFAWSATDRTITLGLHEQPMRVETDCRFVWIGDAMFTRATP